MGCDLYAPAIQKYIRWFGSMGHHGDGCEFSLNETSRRYLDEMFNLLRKLEPVSDNGVWELWLQAVW